MTVADLQEKTESRSGADTGGDWGDRLPKTYESSFFTMILYNSENSIRDIRQFCRPLFRHSRVVKYNSSLLQLWTNN